jgi:hypothetical protein
MKNYFSICILCLAGLSAGLLSGCKKDSMHKGTTSMTEEFDQVYKLQQKGWVIIDNTVNNAGATAPWGQGLVGPDKMGVWYGFTALSYTTTPDEFAYSYIISLDSNYSISSWLITPILSVKSGDKISFYTRGDTTGNFTDRMQVLMNHSGSANVGNSVYSVGDFTTNLFDINAEQAAGGYPTIWTKYEYTFSGISEKTDLRIAFRHYVVNPINARGVGIDYFQFQTN